MKKLLLILLPFTLAFAQQKEINYDSLYTQFLILKNYKEYSKYPSIESTPLQDTKCGFGLNASVKSHFNEFSTDQQNIINKILQRPDLDTSIVSASGKFRIHFDKDGTNKPAYISELSAEENARLVAAAFDSSYNFEVNYLQYPAPPPDEGNGGDNLYDVYIKNYGFGTYGETESENSVGNGNYSYIMLDNDFNKHNYYTNGLPAAQVTAAHEFHHAIQMGICGRPKENDLFFYEVTSTSMEEFVFDTVNDFYNYIKNYFNTANLSLAETTNDRHYGLGIWNIYLVDKYGTKGFDLIKRQWELMLENRAIRAINISLSEMGSSFMNELVDFGKWCYFTNYRTVQDKYFSEAKNYPLVKASYNMQFTPPQKMYTINTKPLTNNYFKLLTNNGVYVDTLFAIITNSDVTNGVNNYEITTPADLNFYDSEVDGSKKISDNLFSKLSGNFDLLSEVDIINNVLVDSGRITSIKETDLAFPNPFNFNTHSTIFFPVAYNNMREASLYIYSPSMDLMYSGFKKIQTYNNKFVVSWDVMDGDNKIPSGVYIYITDSADKIMKGKIVIFND